MQIYMLWNRCVMLVNNLSNVLLFYKNSPPSYPGWGITGGQGWLNLKWLFKNFFPKHFWNHHQLSKAMAYNWREITGHFYLHQQFHLNANLGLESIKYLDIFWHVTACKINWYFRVYSNFALYLDCMHNVQCTMYLPWSDTLYLYLTRFSECFM